MKNKMKKKIVEHLKDDMKTFDKEKKEDKNLVKKIRKTDRNNKKCR